MEQHEGKELKNYLKGKGLQMKEVAEKLGKERQTVNYHLMKEVLEDDFKRLVTEKLKISFPLSKMDVPHGTSENSEMTFTELGEHVIEIKVLVESIWMTVKKIRGEQLKAVPRKFAKGLQDELNELSKLNEEDEET